MGACPLPSRWPSYSLWHIWVQLQAGPHDWGSMEGGTEEGLGQALQPEKIGKHGPAWPFQALAALRRCFLTAQPLLWPSSRSSGSAYGHFRLDTTPSPHFQSSASKTESWSHGLRLGLRSRKVGLDLGISCYPSELGPSTQQKPERDTERGCVVTTKRLMGTGQD